jgi:hypothetical protein
MKMEAVCYSEMLVPTYRTMWCCDLEDHNMMGYVVWKLTVRGLPYFAYQLIIQFAMYIAQILFMDRNLQLCKASCIVKI